MKKPDKKQIATIFATAVIAICALVYFCTVPKPHTATFELSQDVYDTAQSTDAGGHGYVEWTKFIERVKAAAFKRGVNVVSSNGYNSITTARCAIERDEELTGESLVCSLDGGKVNSVTLEMCVLILDEPSKDAGLVEKDAYRRLLERRDEMNAQTGELLSIVLAAMDAENELTYAQMDRLEAAADEALANGSDTSAEEGRFSLNVLIREHDGSAYAHISVEIAEEKK